MSDKTTIQIDKSTKLKLDTIGNKGNTYNDIIEMLLEYYAKNRTNKLLS